MTHPPPSTPTSASRHTVHAADCGGVPNGESLCTPAIQSAIDRCADQGGGTVVLCAGTWLSGTIYLRSHVTLWLDPGCVLLGSPDIADYPANDSPVPSYTDNFVCRSLIAGVDLENIAICGRGTINGHAFAENPCMERPFVIRLVQCRDVLVEGIQLRESGMWMQHYLACDHLRISGIRVWNPGAGNHDGLTIDGCHYVTIDNCIISSHDDAICLKGSSPRSCEHVTVTGCVVSSHCSGIKMGTETTGGFRNIAIGNCVIHPPEHGGRGTIAGLTLSITDGGQMDGVVISNIAIRDIRVPIFIRLGNRARRHVPDAPEPGMGSLRNLMLNNITATGASETGCSITGVPGHPVENVRLSNIDLEFRGGGTREQAERVPPEKTSMWGQNDYPEATMFGTLPAHGIYARHVKGLTLQNVNIRTRTPDARPPLAYDDVG